MKTITYYFHELPAAVQRQFCSCIAAIIYRNLDTQRGEVIYTCDLEIAAFWADCGYTMNVPDSFKSYDYFDTFFRLDGSVDLDRMEKGMFTDSWGHMDEINDVVPDFVGMLYNITNGLRAQN